MRWILGIWAVFATGLLIWVLVGPHYKYPPKTADVTATTGDGRWYCPIPKDK